MKILLPILKTLFYFIIAGYSLNASAGNTFSEHSNNTNLSLGKTLYTQHCTACHGSTGDGGVGVPLSLPDFQANISNEYLRNTIRLGRPDRVMPAFKTLSKSDVTEIITYIRSFSNTPIPKEISTTIKGNVTSGKKLFKQHCASCHGATGEGSKGTGVTFSRPRNLPIMSPALNNLGFLASATDHMIKQAIVLGRRGTPMVSFKKQGLSDSDINDIVSYIRHFQRSKPSTIKQNLSPIISYESDYSLTETIANIKRAAVGKNFKIIRTQNLDYGFVTDDKSNNKQVIIYFCNFKLLNSSLAIDPRVGMFLPCRVTVVERQGKVTVMAINPLRLSKLFNNSELEHSCKAMRDVYIEIIEEAIL